MVLSTTPELLAPPLVLELVAATVLTAVELMGVMVVPQLACLCLIFSENRFPHFGITH
jgi:hypothetical protein